VAKRAEVCVLRKNTPYLSSSRPTSGAQHPEMNIAWLGSSVQASKATIIEGLQPASTASTTASV
jgi:hypothetical protein